MPGSYRLRIFVFGAAALLLGAATPEVTGTVQVQSVKPRLSFANSTRDARAAATANAARARLYGGKPIDVLTYHNDAFRTGWNQNETDLTPASVGSASFGLLTSLNVDGNVFAQPLLVSGFVMPDGSSHDVLVIATGNDTVYAYDARTFALLWQVSLGTPQATNDIGCQDVQPTYGISSTPVILRSGAGAATIYLVSATEPAPFSFQTQLHALDLRTGLDVTPPVQIAPSATLSDGSTLAFDPKNQWSRAGLAAGSGSIYVSIGSHCDNNAVAISGWLLRYSLTLVPMAAFHTIQTPNSYELASIWMSGFAPAIDPAGNVFVVTGNGETWAYEKDWGESVLSLTPALNQVRNRFTPSAYRKLDNSDSDLGSAGVMLLPPVAGQTVPPLGVVLGKPGVLYLLNQAHLGGLTPNDGGAMQAITVTARTRAGLWGGPAYYDGAKGPTIYTQTDTDVLRAYTVSTTGTAALTATVTGTTLAGYGGSMPIVSSNGSTPATGVVWLIRRTNPIQLEAYNADMLGAPIFTAVAGGPWSNPTRNNPFLTPMVANGNVYVPGYKTVEVFGLLQ